MPQNERRSRHTADREILAYPAGEDAIKSVVVAASGIPTLASAIVGEENVKGLLAGTPLEEVPGDAQGRVRKYTTGTIIGILGSNLFFNGEGQDFDAPADAYFHSCVFRKDRIVGYSDGSTASDLADDLYTCQFV
jgi:hypothetical protein